MTQKELGEYESTGVTCPVCGDGYETYKAYAIHFSRSDSHNGISLVELVGESTFRDYHWTLTREEMADELGVGTSTLGSAIEELGLPRASEQNRVEYEYDTGICEVLDRLHNKEEMTTTEMAETLDVSRISMDRWWEECPDVHKRSQSEATQLTYEQMDEDERLEQVKDAHEAVRNNHATYRTSHRGYEHWRNYNRHRGSEEFVKVHRLLAVAEFGFDAVADSIVHHKTPIPWLNYGENIQLVDSHEEHSKLHRNKRETDAADRFI